MKLFTSDERLKDAVDWANQYFASNDFVKDIRSVEKYEHSNITPAQIADLFGHFSTRNIQIEVKLSYFGWFYKNVLGRTVGDGFVYVNSSGLNRQTWSVAATVVHEASHVVDQYFPKASFGHGSNSSKGKGKSFPYFIDERAEAWIKKEILLKEAKRLSMSIALKRELIAC